MHPILFTAGGLQVSSYHFFYGLGGVVGGMLGWELATRRGVPPLRMLGFYLVLFPLSVLAGLLNGLLFDPEFHAGLHAGQLILGGGIVTYGGIAMAYALTAASARLFHSDAGRDLDLLARILAVMLVFFRIGCLLNGCCFGRETNGFGGMYLPDAQQHWAFRYPTQFLLIALDLALAAGLWLHARRDPPAGALAAAFAFWFGLGRLLIDALRPLPPVLGGLSLHMLADLLFLLAGAVAWLWNRLRRDRAG